MYRLTVYRLPEYCDRVIQTRPTESAATQALRRWSQLWPILIVMAAVAAVVVFVALVVAPSAGAAGGCGGG